MPYKGLSCYTLTSCIFALLGLLFDIDTDCYETIEPHLHMDYTVSKGYTSLCVNVVEGYHDSDYLIWGEQLRDFVSELVDVSDRMTLEDQYVLITAALIEMEESAKER